LGRAFVEEWFRADAAAAMLGPLNAGQLSALVLAAALGVVLWSRGRLAERRTEAFRPWKGGRWSPSGGGGGRPLRRRAAGRAGGGGPFRWRRRAADPAGGGRSGGGCDRGAHGRRGRRAAADPEEARGGQGQEGATAARMTAGDVRAGAGGREGPLRPVVLLHG